MRIFKYLLISFLLFSCNHSVEQIIPNSTAPGSIPIADSSTKSTAKIPYQQLNISSVSKKELVSYAKTLIGTPYKYASTDPLQGFDCSGFITYVFNHFNVDVPRSSVDFTNVGKPIPVTNATAGDLVLFTGTVDSIRVVGHMGIVTETIDTLKFIHATSGRANGVTISTLYEHYQKRFVKVIRIFAD